MKGKLLTFLVLPLFVFAFLLISFPAQVVDAHPDDSHKVNICHATSSLTNPYNLISVDKNSTASGHDSDHNDIIPPFTYTVSEVVSTNWVCPNNYTASSMTCPGRCYKNSQPSDSSKCVNKISQDVYGNVDHTYVGLNWTTDGQAIWNNKCVVPTCLHTTEVPSAWGNWTLDAANNREFRTRLVSIVDAQNSTISCGSARVETQYRPIQSCAYQTTVYGSWSDWALYPDDNTQEYIVRTKNNVDTYNTNTICNADFEYQYRTTPVCKYTNTDYSDWSEWEINSDDTTQYIRTRTVTVNDSVYENSCSSETESETKPVDACTLTFNGDIVWGDWTVDPKDSTKEYRLGSYTIYDSNDPSITCGTENVDPQVRNVDVPQDTDGEVKGVTDVVTAQTAGGISEYAYVLQAALILITANLFVALGKEYLKK